MLHKMHWVAGCIKAPSSDRKREESLWGREKIKEANLSLFSQFFLSLTNCLPFANSQFAKLDHGHNSQSKCLVFGMVMSKPWKLYNIPVIHPATQCIFLKLSKCGIKFASCFQTAAVFF